MEIKTCPCCGGIPIVEETQSEQQVKCLDCGLKILRPIGDITYLLNAWNRRVKLGLLE